MSTAPFFFLLASLLIMVRDGEVRFLLVQLDDSEDVGLNTAPGNFPKPFYRLDYIGIDNL